MTEKQPSFRLPSALPPPVIISLAGFFLLAAAFLTGAGAGFGLGRWTASGAPPDVRQAPAPAVYECVEQPAEGAAAQLYPEFGVFWEAMDLLYANYYGDLPDSEEAAFAAIRSVTGLLGDPNTSFLTPQEADYYRSGMEGAFEGIGARVGWDEEADTLVITEPFENRPAWLAGLRRGDLILAVDGKSIMGWGMTESVALIRGPEGSTVTLTVLRPGRETPFDVEVVRARIDVPAISTDMLGEDGRIAYIRLNAFNENAGQLVGEAVKDALQREPAGMILDLRGNSGGLLREAVAVAGIFLENKIVLLERFGDGRVETYRTGSRAVAPDVPLAVMVDEGSASASEIVAGALQDHGRAVLVGDGTFGKGSVQLPYTLRNRGILRVTIATWHTPHDRTIDGVGLQPDIVVVMPEGRPSGGADPQLDAALQHLQKGASGS
jgi:carboxyl-terminal processing protease